MDGSLDPSYRTKSKEDDEDGDSADDKEEEEGIKSSSPMGDELPGR